MRLVFMGCLGIWYLLVWLVADVVLLDVDVIAMVLIAFKCLFMLLDFCCFRWVLLLLVLVDCVYF